MKCLINVEIRKYKTEEFGELKSNCAKIREQQRDNFGLTPKKEIVWNISIA